MAEAEFREVLAEHVRTPLEFSWAEVRVLLGGVGVPSDLDEADREGIFNSVRRAALEQQLAAFAGALQQIPVSALGAEASFEEAHAAALLKLGGEERLRGAPTPDLRSAWEVWRRARLN